MGAVKDDLLNLLRVYWPLLVGNVVEWYEFAVYGFLESFLEDKFFRGSAVATWLGFGVTFLARPIGGAVFGAIGDRCGRSVSVNLTIVGMLVATCGQGCLPTYSGGQLAGNLGLTLLMLLRILQGMSAAGEIGTIATYIAEVGRRESLGRSMALISITCQSGFLAAKAVVFILTHALSEETMQDWGWRVPFLLAAVPGLIAVFGRRGMPESGAFLEERAAAEREQQEDDRAAANGAPHEEGEERPRSKTSVRRVMADHGTNIWIGLGAVAGAATMCWAGFVWTNSYLGKRGMSPNGTMLTSLCARMVLISMAVPTGWVVDRKGVAWLLFACSAGLAVLGLPCFILLDAFPTSLAASLPVIGVCFALLGSSGQCCFLYVVELFPTATRATAMGISYNLGVSLFGGLSPMFCEASLRIARYGPGFVLSSAGLVTAATVLYALVLRRRGRVTLTHVRERPYFSSKRLAVGLGDAPVEVWEEVLSSDGDDDECARDDCRSSNSSACEVNTADADIVGLRRPGAV